MFNIFKGVKNKYLDQENVLISSFKITQDKETALE